MKLKENGLPDFQTALKGDSRDKRCIEDISKVTDSLGEGGREGYVNPRDSKGSRGCHTLFQFICRSHWKDLRFVIMSSQVHRDMSPRDLDASTPVQAISSQDRLPIGQPRPRGTSPAEDHQTCKLSLLPPAPEDGG